jgi:tetratricopeptide (TPR) repeat protein
MAMPAADTATTAPSAEKYLAGSPPLSDHEVELLYGIGRLHYERDQHATAMDLFRVLVLCRPNDARGWFSLAACHEAVDDDERAIALYEVAAAAPQGDEDRLRARLFLARLLDRVGRSAEARERLADVETALDAIDADDGLRSLAGRLRARLGGAS